MKTVEIEIFGRKYYIKSDDPEDVLQKAEILNKDLEELNERFNTVDYNKLFVLYMLILLERNETEQLQNKNLSKELKQVEDLLNNLNED